jgi:hypothetical protein
LVSSGAKRYNIYRDGALVGSSVYTNFSDIDIPMGKTYEYTVTTCSEKQGEGNMSSKVVADTGTTLVDKLDD